MNDRPREVCDGCGQEIDPETCGCGSPIDHYPDGHSPIPMGCDCGRDLRPLDREGAGQNSQ